MKINLSWCAVLLIPTLLEGGLLFNEPHQSFSPGPMDTSVDAVFDFVNEGEYPITIQEIRPSCGCTTAALDQETYAAGESGTIQTTFTIGSRQGLQRKHIQVKTDDPENSEIVLKMEIAIPMVLEITPHFVSWAKGSDRETKTLTLIASEDSGNVKVTRAFSQDSDFDLVLETIEPGKRYELSVTPISTGDAKRNLITIEAELSEGGIAKTFYAHAFVR